MTYRLRCHAYISPSDYELTWEFRGNAGKRMRVSWPQEIEVQPGDYALVTDYGSDTRNYQILIRLPSVLTELEELVQRVAAQPRVIWWRDARYVQRVWDMSYFRSPEAREQSLPEWMRYVPVVTVFMTDAEAPYTLDAAITEHERLCALE